VSAPQSVTAPLSQHEAPNPAGGGSVTSVTDFLTSLHREGMALEELLAQQAQLLNEHLTGLRERIYALHLADDADFRASVAQDRLAFEESTEGEERGLTAPEFAERYVQA